MNTTTELTRGAKTHHTHLITILLTKEGDGAEFPGLIERYLTMLVERDILTDHVIHHPLHLAQLFVRHLLVVREIETQGI